MGTLIKRNWTRGYTPSQNEYVGDPNGLQLAQNLSFDEKGVVRVCRGTEKQSSGPFTGNGEAIFSSVFDLSTLIDGTYPSRAKVRYVGQTNGTVLRNYDPTNKSLDDFGLTVFNTGNSIHAMGSCFGHTLLFSGAAKYKDRGDLQHVLGIPANSAPGVGANSPPSVKADNSNGSGHYDNWDTAAVEGTSYTKNAQTYIAVTTVALDNLARAIIQRGILTTSNIDLNQLSASSVGTSEDLFAFNVRLESSEKLIKIRVEYLLESPTASSTTVDIKNYYWREWTNRVSPDVTQDVAALDFIPADMSQEAIDALLTANPGVTFVPSIREGANVWCPLQCKRGDFNRVGDDDSKNWATVKGIRISYYTTGEMEVLFNEARFIGGDKGQLTGQFTYIQQDFRDTNSYVEYGMPSVESDTVNTYGSSNVIGVNSINPQANGFRIYRLSNATDGFYVIKERFKERIETFSNANPASIHRGAHGLVTGNIVCVRDGVGPWAAATGTYTITVTGPDDFTIPLDSTGFGSMLGDLSYVDISQFNDYVSDADALSGGELMRLDRNKSLLPDDIIGMVAPYFTRAIYITPKLIIPSEQGDPSRYDPRYQLELASDTGEVNLFIALVSEQLILIGTTKTVYALQGTGALINGALDFKLVGLGIDKPPVSSTFIIHDSILHYLAMDGWRKVNGSSNGLLTDELRLMFPPNNETRSGYPAYKVLPANGVKISAVTIGGKLYAAMDQGAAGRSILIYDFSNGRLETRKNIAVPANTPYVFFVEDDGTILFTTEASGDRYLHQAEVNTTYDDGSKIFVELLTVFDDNQQPNNRKDALTLFLDIDSGNDTVTVKLQGLREDNTYQELSFSQAFNGRQRIPFDCSALLPTKKFRLSITTPTGCAAFVVYEYYLEYQERPTQVNFLRLPPNNWGIAGRKRVPEIPMVIDTLGNTVRFTPILDNATKTPFDFVKTDKDVYHHVFNDDQAAYVIGGSLTTITPGGVFEFYDLITPREIEPLPDPLSFKRIPATNLGNGSRKRFIQFAFVIDTRGFNVTFTPTIDGVSFPPFVYNTTRRQTVVYTFVTEALGIDIEGTLNSVTDNEKFEYYGVDLGECISEKLPPAARFVKVPCSNYGTAGKKRIRTIPLVLDTRGGVVRFTPKVDGVAFPYSEHVTTEKRTVLHYFEGDAFGIDYCGELSSDTSFEFYEMLRPEKVEELPVGKKYDQVGPLELKRFGRIYKVRCRVVNTGTALSYNLIIDGVSRQDGTWLTTAAKEEVLEVNFEKFVSGVIVKLELQSTTVFHRMYVDMLVKYSGSDTDNTWVQIK